ncbi:glycosyltransferase family 2 protein [Paenibacillus sp. 1P07SE]|uniref:glycosyltransferase family 2 protein n=1 Tax=Paenibacillus sp. 1P07SE TaxID=3132209 RepID=UPI0039A4089E
MDTNNKRQHVLFVTTMILMTIYLLWRMFFTLPLDQGFWSMVFGILLITAETLTVLTTFELFVQKMNKNRTQLDLPDIPTEHYPHVDVFIATHNEPVDLLYKTVNACTYMDYPDKSKVHIYLCDDGRRPEVQALAEAFGIGYLGAPDNQHAKSGNLNYALSQTDSPLIATFDADMIPQHTFLMKTVPYFLLDRFISDKGKWRLRRDEEIDPAFKLGLVQTPQSFYNPDLFQFNLYAERGIPNEQDFFSREVNILRNTTNAVAYTGSNTVISRRAMEDIGGFPLYTITEDFETSIRMQQAGYITYATQEVQAAGLTTTTVESMIKQRIRWARGILQSLYNTKAIISKKLPLQTNITYLSSYLYWWSFFNRFIFIMAPIMFALFDFQIVSTGFWEILIFWLPAYFCYSVSMRYLSSNIRNQRWSQVIDTIFMPYLIVPVLMESLGIRERKFKVTNKKRGGGPGWVKSVLYALPHLVLLGLSVAAIIRFTSGKYGMALFFSSIIVFWLVHNLVALCYAIFFMIGRRAYRETERIEANEAVMIYDKAGSLSYEARTVDVSEHGIALFVQQPIYLTPQTAISLVVTTDRYEAHLEATIVYVKKNGEGWRYSAAVTPVSEDDKRQYMQIIYDRNHSLPKQLNLWDTAYDDMIRNVKRRIVQPVTDKRKMPRVSLQCPVTFTNGSSCMLRSFNYLYFSASDLHGELQEGDVVTFYTTSHIEVALRHAGKKLAKGKEILFSLENLHDIADRGLLDQLLHDLKQSHSEIA